MLVADYRSGESPRHAEFVFDAPGRYVTRRGRRGPLAGRRAHGPDRAPAAAAGTGAGPAVVLGAPDEPELPLGEDAIGLVSEPGDAPRAGSPQPRPPTPRHRRRAEDTVELTHTSVGDAGVGIEQEIEEARADAAGDLTASERAGLPEPAAGATPGAGGDDVPEPEEDAGADGTAKPKKSSRKRAPRCPSWDEIMFGGGSPE